MNNRPGRPPCPGEQALRVRQVVRGATIGGPFVSPVPRAPRVSARLLPLALRSRAAWEGACQRRHV
jgi:hypothetical protein